jgi:hypothetical protein
MRRIGTSVLLGVIIAALGVWFEILISHKALSMVEAIDDIIIGMFAALVVFSYEQKRYRATMEKIRVIAGMNHHVRNALQAISYAPYTEQAKQIKLIGESVSRIEWALREILPGDPETKDEGSVKGNSRKFPVNTPR